MWAGILCYVHWGIITLTSFLYLPSSPHSLCPLSLFLSSPSVLYLSFSLPPPPLSPSSPLPLLPSPSSPLSLSFSFYLSLSHSLYLFPTLSISFPLPPLSNSPSLPPSLSLSLPLSPPLSPSLPSFSPQSS